MEQQKFFSRGFLIFLVLLLLAFLGLKVSHVQFYKMHSSSMEQKIPKGSFIVEKSIEAENLKTGDIITYMNEDGISVTHEIVGIVDRNQEKEFITKGTENRNVDKNPVKKSQIRGKVLFSIPFLGNLF